MNKAIILIILGFGLIFSEANAAGREDTLGDRNPKVCYAHLDETQDQSRFFRILEDPDVNRKHQSTCLIQSGIVEMPGGGHSKMIGSGVLVSFLSPSGETLKYVLTALHVVEIPAKYTVKFETSDRYYNVVQIIALPEYTNAKGVLTKHDIACLILGTYPEEVVPSKIASSKFGFFEGLGRHFTSSKTNLSLSGYGMLVKVHEDGHITFEMDRIRRHYREVRIREGGVSSSKDGDGKITESIAVVSFNDIKEPSYVSFITPGFSGSGLRNNDGDIIGIFNLGHRPIGTTQINQAINKLLREPNDAESHESPSGWGEVVAGINERVKLWDEKSQTEKRDMWFSRYQNLSKVALSSLALYSCWDVLFRLDSALVMAVGCYFKIHEIPLGVTRKLFNWYYPVPQSASSLGSILGSTAERLLNGHDDIESTFQDITGIKEILEGEIVKNLIK
ncbi:MAG: hypothetical protein K2Y18_00155 [Alphaproteobacteria bacterium]|jgi:hypothetical protein|nr:hypothetical protein [Alphaproteobacteria bacterium]